MTNVPLYGVPIHDAIASGDVDKMKSVAEEAEKHVKEYGDVADGLRKLRAEIARLEGGSAESVRQLYGPAIQEAIASGDLSRMKDVAKQAENQLKLADELRSALDEVKKAIASQTGS